MPGDMMDWVTSNPIPMAIIIVLLLAAAYLYMSRDSFGIGGVMNYGDYQANRVGNSILHW